jgi:hypothetical protein
LYKKPINNLNKEASIILLLSEKEVQSKAYHT